jgi:CheY-like chemotaxis protein
MGVLPLWNHAHYCIIDATINMVPKLNGYEVAQRFKSEEWARSTVLVALTSWREEHDPERAESAGFDRYLLKPLQAGALQELLDSVPPR